MRTLIACLLLSASTTLAQTPGPILLPALFPVQLKQYLGISDDQVTRMSSIKQQSYTLQAPKFARQFQLQMEIAQETAKTAPDPSALGTRYAEVESIRRELDTIQKNLITQVQTVLGADQKAKLATLQQALLLYSTACSAVSENLLSPPPVPNGLIGGITGQIPAIGIEPLPYSSFLLGGLSSGACAGPSGVTIFTRTGDFSPVPLAPQP